MSLRMHSCHSLNKLEVLRAQVNTFMYKHTQSAIFYMYSEIFAYKGLLLSLKICFNSSWAEVGGTINSFCAVAKFT